MYNQVEDSGKGDPMFYELTDDEIKLHDEKNQDYRSTSNPVANFDRVAAWMALYPDMDWARPEMVAILYAQKQIDSAMSLMERGVEGGVETIDTRARDVHIYWKLFRVIRRKHNTDRPVAYYDKEMSREEFRERMELLKPRSLWQRFLARIGL